jgi:hypothetical protein
MPNPHGAALARLGTFAVTMLPPERDDFSSNRHPALSFCLSVISGHTLRVCPEGKPVPTFPGYRPAQSEIRGEFFGMPWMIPNLLFHDKPVPLSNVRSHGRNQVFCRRRLSSTVVQ